MKSFIIFLCLLAATVQFVLPNSAHAEKPFDEEQFENFLEKLISEEKFGGSVAIFRNNKPFFAKTSGFKWIGEEGNIPSDQETLYRVGSLTKTYTAVMILQLIEEQKLALGTPLAEFYEDFPNAEDITIEHLLRHQSGLYNFTDSAYLEYMEDEVSKAELLDKMLENEAEFSPGESTAYSNTNYVLLGYILEDITGDSYGENLQQRIAEKLDLNNTFFNKPVNPEKNLAHSYEHDGDSWQPSTKTNLQIAHGAGGVVSTYGEVIRFMQGLFQHELLNESTLEKMISIESGLGMGLIAYPFHEKVGYGHNGRVDGFNTSAGFFAEDSVYFVILSNQTNFSINEMLIAMLSYTYGYDYEQPSFETITLEPEQLPFYEGTFVSAELPIDLEIMVEGNRLKAQATGQPSFPLTPETETRFRFDPAGVVLEFKNPDNGSYKNLILHQGGGQFEFSRTD